MNASSLPLGFLLAVGCAKPTVPTVESAPAIEPAIELATPPLLESVGIGHSTVDAATPSVLIGRLEIEGSRDPDSLSVALRGARSSLQACLRESMTGTVKLVLEVEAVGTVSSVGVASSSLDNPEAETCFADALKGVSFPEAAERARVVLPLVVAFQADVTPVLAPIPAAKLHGQTILCKSEGSQWRLTPEVAEYLGADGHTSSIPLAWFGNGGDRLLAYGDGLWMKAVVNYGCFGPVTLETTIAGAKGHRYLSCRREDEDDDSYAVCVRNVTDQREVARETAWSCPATEATSTDEQSVWALGFNQTCCAYPSAQAVPDSWPTYASEAACDEAP